jgi:hypothetical protein
VMLDGSRVWPLAQGMLVCSAVPVHCVTVFGARNQMFWAGGLVRDGAPRAIGAWCGGAGDAGGVVALAGEGGDELGWYPMASISLRMWAW